MNKGGMRRTWKPEGKRQPGKPRRRWEDDLISESYGNRTWDYESHSTRLQ